MKNLLQKVSTHQDFQVRILSTPESRSRLVELLRAGYYIWNMINEISSGDKLQNYTDEEIQHRRKVLISTLQSVYMTIEGPMLLDITKLDRSVEALNALYSVSMEALAQKALSTMSEGDPEYVDFEKTLSYTLSCLYTYLVIVSKN